VATVVLKLLQLAQPTHAYFGKKDYQQLAVVRQLVRDLDVPVEIVGAPTIREPDGLARSSRNVYLSPEERQRALALSRGLRVAQKAFAAGETSAAKLEAMALEQVKAGCDSVDYVAVRDARTLAEIERVEKGGAVLLIAAKLGRTRLIDNAVFGEPIDS
jgi:pantoate--beta-alanine ligase